MPRIDFASRELRLGFCTNVLPGGSVDDILDQLDQVLPSIRGRALGGDSEPMGLGLWLPASLAAHLDSQDRAARDFAESMGQRGLEIFTLNGFPYGDFHQERVKDGVFRPSWAESSRLEYTLQLGRLLASWLPPGESGSISTLSGGFKSWGEDHGFRRACAAHLLHVAADWHHREKQSGHRLVLGIEPEPRSTLETTGELVDFFENHLLGPAARDLLAELGVESGRAEEVVRRHLGVCYDACHQAVEFEDAVDALDTLRSAGITIAKLQITNALEVEDPGRAEQLALLSRFAEPRYLHQVARRDQDGTVLVADDLETLLTQLDDAWRRAQRWRIHFHVPVHRQEISGLGTTRGDLLAALTHVLRDDLTRHLEVETYTWGVLPGESGAEEQLAQGLAEEMRWTLDAIRACEADGAS